MIRDVNALIHIAALQFLQGELLAHLIAGLQINSLGLQGLHVLLETQTGLPGHIAQHLVDGVIVIANAGALGELHLDILHDQRLQHLALHLRNWRELPTVSGGSPANVFHALIEFALQYHVAINNGNNPVQHRALLRCGWQHGAQAQQAGHQELRQAPQCAVFFSAR